MNAQTENSVPAALKYWFILHFIADITFAVPLFLAPEAFLKLLGWHGVDPITTRMVAAALFGIGTESFLCRNSSRDVFLSMLNLKIIWSISAIGAIGIALIRGLYGIPMIGWLLLLIFVSFNILWVYWRIKIK